MDVTRGELTLLAKADKAEYVTVDDGSEDHRIAEKMVDKSWLNRAFIMNGRTSYNLIADGKKIVDSLV